MNTVTSVPATLPPAIPISHQSHPFWNIRWEVVLPIALKALQVADTLAPAVVAVTDKKDPEGVAEAAQLSGLASTILAGVESVAPATP